jgi:hypothetical protein
MAVPAVWSRSRCCMHGSAAEGLSALLHRIGLGRFVRDKNATRRLLEAPGKWRNDLQRSAT